MNANKVDLSVIIPCFNQGEFILDAISSVETCVEPVYEIIIINDGSTEPLTKKVLNSLKAKGYTVIDQNNQGLAKARNRGIELANGRYILPLDADNKVRARYITQGIEILDSHPEVGVFFGVPELFGDNGFIKWDIPGFNIDKILTQNYIDACAVFRKVVWKDCGGYDSKMPIQGWEDWDFWLSTVEKGWKFHFTTEILFDYRVRVGSMISFCNLPENRKTLLRYLCTKHIDLYAANLVNIIVEKDFAYWSQRTHLQKIQSEVAAIPNIQSELAALQMSKFWKLRTAWLRIKKNSWFGLLGGAIRYHL